MKENHYARNHIILIAALVIIGFLIVAVIKLLYGDQIENLYIGGKQIGFHPVYNENGSWFHGKIGIGYQRGLLLAENLVILVCSAFVHRWIEYCSRFFRLGGVWSFFMDFGLAAGLARLFQNLGGFYTLDYVYIDKLSATYDFFDFLLYLMCAGILVWLVLYCIRYYSYRARETKGMKFWPKFLWSWRLSLKVMKETLKPIKNWDYEFENRG